MAITSTAPVATPPAAKSERTVRITGTQSWTAPADVSSVDILLVAGGGGGGGGGSTSQAIGGGGGGAGWVTQTISVTPSTAYTITIGGGGSAGGSQGSGGVGGSSSFGALWSVAGGGGGGAGYIVSGTGYTTYPTYGATGGGGGGINGGYAGTGGSLEGFHGTPTFFNTDNPSASYTTDQMYGTSGLSFSINAYAKVRGTFPYGGPGSGGYSAGYTSTVRFKDAGPGGGLGAFVINNVNTAAQAGTANTGGGGGGGAAGPSGNQAAAAGGSGVCIIKYWSAL